MTDTEVIAAIRRTHLKANISAFEDDREAVIYWERARIDPGGSIFGPGPYLKVPVWSGAVFEEEITHRVYAPARLRRRLARLWTRSAALPPAEERQP